MTIRFGRQVHVDFDLVEPASLEPVVFRISPRSESDHLNTMTEHTFEPTETVSICQDPYPSFFSR